MVGRQDWHWLQLDPRSLREWAMSPLAIMLGLRPTTPAECARLPERVRVTDVLRDDGALPEDCIYVGMGHHSHRIPTTQWKSPWVAGHSCTHDEWLPLYVEHIRRSHCGTSGQLPTLSGKRLACDCDLDEVCEADAVAGLCFDFTSPSPSGWKGATGRAHDNAGI